MLPRSIRRLFAIVSTVACAAILIHGAAQAEGPILNAASEQFAPDRADSSEGRGSAATIVTDPRGTLRLAEALSSTALKPDADTFVSSDRPNDHFGSDGRLCVGQRPGYGATRTLLHFKHTELDRKEAVTGAALRLYQRDYGPAGDGGRDLVLRQLTDDWSESEASWNRFPGFDEDVLASNGVGPGTGWDQWESGALTRLVQKWRYPEWQSKFALYRKYYADNQGLYLQGYEAGNSFRCFESTNTGNNRPELRLEHTTDRTAPTSALLPLPIYSSTPKPDAPNTAAIRLEWSGQDPEPATEIDFFQLYFKRGAEAWALAADKLQAFSGVFGGENGRRYGFRIQAVDQAGNIELGDAVETETLVDISAPVTTLQTLPAYVPGPFVLTWSGSDLPVGPGLEASGIATYNVLYNINGGGWDHLARDLTTTVLPVTPYEGLTYQFEVYAVDKAGNREPVGTVEAQTIVDGQPPITWFEPVLTIDQPTFMVRWSGRDIGASGIDSYDIQMRVDLGPWTDWLAGTRDTSGTFHGDFEHVYDFRARARDRAGNLGAYPDRPQMTAGVLHRNLLTHIISLPLVATR